MAIEDDFETRKQHLTLSRKQAPQPKQKLSKIVEKQRLEEEIQPPNRESKGALKSIAQVYGLQARGFETMFLTPARGTRAEFTGDGMGGPGNPHDPSYTKMRHRALRAGPKSNQELQSRFL